MNNTTVQGPSAKVMSFGCIGVVTIVLVGGLMVWFVSVKTQLVLDVLTGVLISIAATIIGTGITWLASFVWHSIQRAIHDRAKAREAIANARRAEWDARYSVVKGAPGEQVYIADHGHAIVWRAAHHDPRIHAADGQWCEPSEIEIASYLAYLESITPRVAGTPAQQLLTSPDTVDLIDQVSDFERMLIVGSSGSGKTTLLQHIIARRKGKVVVIDPHDDTHTWPDNAEVIGAGQDYEAIEKALVWMVGEVRDRYRQRATGDHPEFTQLMVAVDEWREIVGNTGTAASSLKTVLTGGRKVSMGVVIATHSERVTPLGIKGEGDLKDGFYVVRLRGDKYTGISATLDKGNGEAPVKLPGPYVPYQLPAPESTLDLANVELPMDETERAILAAWDAGTRSVTRIGIEVYGQKGGKQNKLVTDVLRKHHRI